MKEYKVDENVVTIKGIGVDLRYQPGMRKEDKDVVLEKALKKFKRKVKDSRIMLEIQRRAEFKKPSAVKREKRLQSLLRCKYVNKKNNK